MSIVDQRKPLAAKETNTMSELTPNSKEKLEVDIRQQLQNRAQMMNAAFQRNKARDEALKAAAAPQPEEQEQEEAAAPARQEPSTAAPETCPPPAEPVTAKAAVVKPPAIEVPTKVVAPEITPPANPNPAPQAAPQEQEQAQGGQQGQAAEQTEAAPAPQEKKERKRTKLDGQDGLVQAVCLLPERRPRDKKKEERKKEAHRPHGTIPPPRLSGGAPARGAPAPAQEEPVVEEVQRRPRVPPLNLRGVGGPAPDAPVPPPPQPQPAQVPQGVVPRRFDMDPRREVLPAAHALPHRRAAEEMHAVHRPVEAGQRHDVFSRDFAPVRPEMPAPAMRPGVAGAAAAAPMPYGMYYDRHIPVPPVGFGAHPAPSRPMMRGAGGYHPVQPAVDVGGYRGIIPPVSRPLAPAIDDAALARLIARQEYGW